MSPGMLLVAASAMLLAGCREAAPEPAAPAASTARVTVLGFEPFGAYDVNPTEGFVADLPPQRYRTGVLPVDPDALGGALLEVLAVQPPLVVAVGVREDAGELELNHAALNWTSVAEPGAWPYVGPIDPALPLEIALPDAEVDAIEVALDGAGVRYERRRDAGLHVCNQALFLGIAHRLPGTRFVLFHVPPGLLAEPALAANLTRAIDALAAAAEGG